ncbi:ATP-binding protein [Cronobacter dublinensis]
MELFTRQDSSFILKKIEKSLIIGNDKSLSKMVNLSNLILDESKNKLLSKLDYLPTIFLYGPPNTGKTTLVYRLFQKIKLTKNNIELYYMNFSSVMSSEYGSTSKNIVSVFSDLFSPNLDNPKILLIDEIDQFCMSRDRNNEHDASRRAMSSLMLEIDKLHPSNKQGLIVIAISNVQGMIDPAIIRRFNLKLKINETLDFDEFKQYINEIQLDFKELNLNDEIGSLYEIYIRKSLTISDIKGCFRDALNYNISELLSSDIIIKSFENAYSSVTNNLES